jgi:hypothetical protein
MCSDADWDNTKPQTCDRPCVGPTGEVWHSAAGCQRCRLGAPVLGLGAGALERRPLIKHSTESYLFPLSGTCRKAPALNHIHRKVSLFKNSRLNLNGNKRSANPEKQVAWIKSDTKAVLAIHDHVITNNARLDITHNDKDTWTLTLKRVKTGDRGPYMCQVMCSCAR